MKFYLDEDISPKAAQILRKRGIDAVSAHEIGMAGGSDEEQLAEAVSRNAAMVTRNRADFLALTIRAFENLSPHHGVVVFSYNIPGSNFKFAARMLERLATKNPDGLGGYTIEFVTKIRSYRFLDSLTAVRISLVVALACPNSYLIKSQFRSILDTKIIPNQYEGLKNEIDKYFKKHCFPIGF